ncbi:MAG: hypothetical protein JWL94_2360 [Microbacteriaceae bacterium]|jgi:hypothetical protein|nr:hypothetical protein [Microbacteriaceae bacterium]
MTIELTTEQLAAELERRRQQEQQDQQHRADALREAQDNHARRVLDAYETLDAQLTSEGRQHQDAALRALRDLDLNAAFARFTQWKATRIIRQDIRDSTRSAAARLNDPRIIPELRDALEPFNEWLARETTGMSRPELFLAEGRADELLGTQPLTYEDLEANSGN